jgi:Kef-type K+ transport system membrane component KefB
MRWLLLPVILFLADAQAFASNTPVSTTSTNDYDPIILFWLVVFIFLSRSLSIVRKIGIPIIVAEILTGVILGDLHSFGINMFANSENNLIIKFLAELGAIILMFEIGLESKFSELRKNFKSGFMVAASGTAFTFFAGYLISLYLIPNTTLPQNLLMGVITAATATGVSARIFKDMKILHSREVKFVLVASIIDELISIFCFGIISGLAIDDAFNLVTTSVTALQVFAFFGFAAVFSNWITPFITHWSTKIHAGIHMKIGVLFSICLLFSWIAFMLGLATVVGAFVAGLILDQVYFKSFSKSSFINNIRRLSLSIAEPETRDKLVKLIDGQEERDLEELLKPFSHMFTPMFFIYIGLMMNVEALFEKQTLMITIALLCASFIGRIMSGYTLKTPKKINRLLIGLGMTPIGEAGLIFAVFGKNAGLISNDTLAAIVATLVIAAILTPILTKIAVNFDGINYD